jgi:hypothetical protein
MYSVVPQSHPSLLRAVRDTEQETEGIGMLRPRELSGENSPHYIYSVLKKENVSLGFKDCATFFEWYP